MGATKSRTQFDVYHLPLIENYEPIFVWGVIINLFVLFCSSLSIFAAIIAAAPRFGEKRPSGERRRQQTRQASEARRRRFKTKVNVNVTGSNRLLRPRALNSSVVISKVSECVER